MPAPDIEKLVLEGVRKHFASMGETEHPTAIEDHDLIERHVERVVVKSQAVELRLAVTNEGPAETERPSVNDQAARQLPPVITLRSRHESGYASDVVGGLSLTIS